MLRKKIKFGGALSPCTELSSVNGFGVKSNSVVFMNITTNIPSNYFLKHAFDMHNLRSCNTI